MTSLVLALGCREGFVGSNELQSDKIKRCYHGIRDALWVL